MCSTGIGHQECLTQFTTVDHVDIKADEDSWRRSKKKIYKKKIARQKGIKL